MGSSAAPFDDAWVERDGEWSERPLTNAPRDAQAAVFSPRDWRVWVIDGRGSGKKRTRHLMRIDADAGWVETDVALRVLNAFDRVWLTTIEDGRVVFVGAIGPTYTVALLSAEPFAKKARIRVDGAWFGLGEVVVGPDVGDGDGP